jgi:hypothetical protein
MKWKHCGRKARGRKTIEAWSKKMLRSNSKGMEKKNIRNTGKQLIQG